MEDFMGDQKLSGIQVRENEHEPNQTNSGWGCEFIVGEHFHSLDEHVPIGCDRDIKSQFESKIIFLQL